MSNQLPTEYSRLLCRHIFRSLSEEEKEELERHVEESDDLMSVFEQVTDPAVYYAAKELLDPVNLSKVLDRIKTKGKGRAKFTTTVTLGPRIVQFNKWSTPYKIAATVAAVFLVGFLITINTGKQTPTVLAKTSATTDKGEVHSSATSVTLKNVSDDGILNLEDISEGASIENGGFITSMQDGQLTYKLKANKEAQSHTLAIPYGTTANVTLPDESNVLLNAMSSMQVVSSASGALKIIISGEAFIESSTAPSSHLTLEVKDRMLIEVAAGTHMNVNAYNNEPTVSASILSGNGESRITAGGKTALLTLNQEARFRGNAKSDTLLIVNMDASKIDATKAWKEGLFDLRSTNLETIMRQISRWYNVNVVYEGNASTSRSFGASLQRNIKLEDIIVVLQKNGVDVKLKGNELYWRN